jgi:hypothetical protein
MTWHDSIVYYMKTVYARARLMAAFEKKDIPSYLNSKG